MTRGPTSPSAAEQVAGGIDRLVCWLGRAIAWLCLAMVLMTATVVVLRYFFDSGWIWMQESVTWMHGLVFMLAAAYTLSLDEHVRVDIFYSRLSPRHRIWIDSAGVILLLLPTCGWIFFSAWDYVLTSWSVHESSAEAGGLPGLFLLKTVILLTPLLLAIEGVALMILRWLRLGAAVQARGAPEI
jgi:TRAP-type mannitol/chloroaromatic compound transport system permease small subunit